MNLLKEQIKSQLKKAGVKVTRLETPPEGIRADLAFPCFGLAKKLKKNPAEIAKDLAKKIRPGKLVKKIEAVGPYLNFYADWGKLGQLVLEEILKKKDKFGSAKFRETIMMDVYQANPFKSFHIGHVRNAVFGEAVRRLLEFTGRKTVTATYNGDVGVHVARWLWYFKKFYKGPVPKKNFAKWVGQMYAKSSRKMMASEKYEDEVNKLNKLLDKRDKKIVPIWKKFRKLCYDDYRKIARELDVSVDRNLPESICEGPGKKWVQELRKKGRLTLSEGAVGLDLEKYGLGFFLLLKSDGTALYSTKDLGLLQQKNKICKYNKSLFVVGSEQDFYLKQLFKAFEVLGLPGAGKNIHVAHGLVTLKEGKMASRLGNVILYEDLRDETIKRVLEQMKGSKVKSKEKIAKQVAFGAIKFSMLNVENNKFIKFDWDEALDIGGKSGPYLQYTAVRANSILKKSKLGKFDAGLLKDEMEINLIKKISQFPEFVLRASETYEPHIITNYLFDLAQDFNTFYQKLPVLKAEPNLKAARLGLVKAVEQILKNGLWLLGIEVPGEM